MKTITQYLSKLFSASTEASMKRMIGFLALLGLFMCFIADICSKTIQVELIYSFTTIVIGALGLTSIDRLTTKK